MAVNITLFIPCSKADTYYQFWRIIIKEKDLFCNKIEYGHNWGDQMTPDHTKPLSDYL